MILRALPVLVALLCVRPVLAQSAVAIDRGDRSIGGWLGFARSSHIGGYAASRRELLTVGARAEWVVERFGPFALAATADLIPLAVVTHNPTYEMREISYPELDLVHQYKQETGTKPVFGAGVAPFGLKLYVGSSRTVRLYGATAVGGLWFTREMPIPEAGKFNVLVEGGGGCEIVRRSGRAVILGYKFHHLSNANRAPSNPGLDSHVFYFGLSRAR